jgi:hypothetical protein
MPFPALPGGRIGEYSMCSAKNYRIFRTLPRRDTDHEQKHTLAEAKR